MKSGHKLDPSKDNNLCTGKNRLIRLGQTEKELCWSKFPPFHGCKGNNN